MLFRLAPLRFSFIARESVHFDEGKSSNILRGAFGAIFRRIACLPDCPGTAACEHSATCPYARLFEPTASSPGPSGLADHPRPFVFRATHLDGQTFAPGQTFHFDLNLFDTDSSPAIAYLTLTFAQLAHDGLGRGRSKVELTTVTRLNEQGTPAATVYENGFVNRHDELPPLELDLSPLPQPVSHIKVNFLTPTELKSDQQTAARPGFAILASRIRDRISTLRELYGQGPLTINFREFGERAALVRMNGCDIKHVEVQRRSTRTGQTHSIGGFVGEAEYEGDLAEFLPYLRAAQWTGVGRQTVWGKGQILTET